MTKYFMPSLLLAVPAFAKSAELDAERTEREVMRVLDDFMWSFNARDAAGEERTYHFPHFRLASGQMRVLETAGAQTQAAMVETYRRLIEPGWDRSAWTRRKIVHMSADKAHVDTQFTRYRMDGSIIGAFDSPYVGKRSLGNQAEIELRAIDSAHSTIPRRGGAPRRGRSLTSSPTFARFLPPTTARPA